MLQYGVLQYGVLQYGTHPLNAPTARHTFTSIQCPRTHRCPAFLRDNQLISGAVKGRAVAQQVGPLPG